MSAQIIKLKQLNSGLIVSIVLILIALPLVWQITFPQNDDWVYRRMVQNFMHGNFTLDPISAPTFYFQGILGTLFSLVFGISRLPVLTLLVSVLNFYLLYKILSTSTKLGTNMSIVVALVWFFNPINIYSSLGFMTENYLLFCILASLYFFNLYITDIKPRHFLLFNLFLLFGFMTKQSALVLAAAYPAYFLVNKYWRLFGLQMLLAALISVCYFLFFPKTAEMYEKPLQFHYLYELDYIKQLMQVLTIYISAFCFPLLVFLIPKINVFKKRKAVTILLVVSVISLFVSLMFFINFKPNQPISQEFFYLDNILERTGFYPRGVTGTKFYFRGIYDLYRYWDIIAKFFAGFVVVGLVISTRKIKTHTHLLIFFLTYFLLMLLAIKVYDRYLPPLFLAFVLLMATNFDPTILSKNIQRLLSGLFLSFLAFLILYSYQFSMDFVLVNRYIWDRSLQLVHQEKIAPKLIKGTNAWKLLDYNIARNYLYDFTFDSTKVNEVYCKQYDLVERHRIDFPGSLFVDPYIYLYKKKI